MRLVEGSVRNCGPACMKAGNVSVLNVGNADYSIKKGGLKR